jgi:type IV pilus assembly protein PilY1
MYQNDFGANLNEKQNIVTYTIAATGGDPSLDYVQQLTSMARRGGGKAFVAADVNSIVQALLQIFYEVQAVNSVFGSATLPVSVNTRGTYQNQVYMGMFRPDGSGAPRWMGNLKQYQFGVDTSDPISPKLFLADSTGAAAISACGNGLHFAQRRQLLDQQGYDEGPGHQSSGRLLRQQSIERGRCL